MDAAQLRKRADQANRLGQALTSPDDRARILAYAAELTEQAEEAERLEARWAGDGARTGTTSP